MAWYIHRNISLVILVVTSLLLFGFGSVLGIDVNKGIFDWSIKWSVILAIGQLYIAYALWQSYM